MKAKKIIPIIVWLACAIGSIKAQTNTFYFMDELPMRNTMNPAFLPNTKFYFDFVFLPNLYLSAGNNSFAMKDFLINQNGQTVTALHPSMNVDDFYKKIKKTTSLETEFQLNLLSFGFRFKEKNYLTFDLDFKVNATAYVPRDIFKLGLYGTPDEFGVNSFNFKSIGVDASVYSEAGIGYMRRINDQWTVGGKLKFLMGYAGVTSKVNKMSLKASQDSWDLDADAQVYGSLPMSYDTKEDGTIDFNTFNLYEQANGGIDIQRYLELLYRPAGYGGAIDLGVTYEPIKHLVLSASITDLGFIRWNKNLIQGSMAGTYQYNGIYYEPGDSIDLEKIGQEIEDAFEFKSEGSSPFTQMLRANAHIAVEYGILNNKISFGLLSRTRFNAAHVTQEVTLATNFRPLDWLKAYVSYSFVNSRWNNIGLGLNLRAGMFNMFIAADYIPLNWAYIYSSENARTTVPYNTQRVNLQMGMSWNIGRDSGDKDRDGVKNIDDKCPKTGIKSLRKLCPNTPRKKFVDAKGCTLDEDKDGVPDCYDKCHGTKKGVKVDKFGCPLDSDQDGVPNTIDKCPKTPEGVEVDSNGCPLDDDNDGVPNYLDKCPNTPEGIKVDKNGCPIDTDKDSIPDYLDKCPNTPVGVLVDANGCPRDEDMDGIPDYLDKCPNTPKDAFGQVDQTGCPKDSDGDGVPDYLDKCPKEKGSAENHGCPELKKEVRNLFKKAMQGIQFETGKDVIKKSSYPILDAIANVLIANPTYNLNISGYTDNVGNPKFNQVLSAKRAASVKRYLASKNVEEARMNSAGYGQENPIADNKTAAGRAQNRRVEFEVVFESISYEKVVNPELNQLINTK